MTLAHKTYIRLASAAQQHGEDEGADTEAGDLQVFLNVALSLMTTSQLEALMADDEVVETLATAEGEEDEE